MSGKKSRDKGARGERHLKRLLQDRGFAAERIPLSGAAGGKFRGDVTAPFLGIDRRFEVKVRADGFRELYGWLADDVDFLVVKADRREALLITRLRFALDAAEIAEGIKLPARSS